jgi:hypothetical protein
MLGHENTVMLDRNFAVEYLLAGRSDSWGETSICSSNTTRARGWRFPDQLMPPLMVPFSFHGITA